MCVCRLLHLCAHICEPFLHFHNIEKIYIYMSLILQNYLLRCKCISNLPVPISCITFINYFTTASHSLQFFFFNWMYFSENPYIYFSWNFFFLFQKKKKHILTRTFVCLYLFLRVVICNVFHQWVRSIFLLLPDIIQHVQLRETYCLMENAG